MNVFITGGSGFLGINLIRYLMQKGSKIVSYDMAPFEYPEKDQIQTIVGDIRDPLTLEKAMADSHLSVWREVGHDMIQLENSTCAMAGALGCEIGYDKSLPPHVISPLIDSYELLDDLEPPDPFTVQPLKARVEAADILQKRVGDRVFVQALFNLRLTILHPH